AATSGVQSEGQHLLVFARGPRGSGFRVASQKSEPDAGEVPRFARQHTNVARKEPESASGWTPAGPPLDTEVQKAPRQRKGESELSSALSPSCLRNSMDLLQMSKEKVLQHIGVAHAF